jgi:hypothetical protein
MKKSTGIIFLVAAALAAFVYFYDMKHNAPSKETPADASKPAFSVSSDDITGMQLERAGNSVVFVRQGDGWYITQPLATRADQSVLDGVATQLSTLRVDRTLAATPDQLASFGLDKPAVTIDFTLKSGAKHTLQLGAKDFSGSSAYAIVDNSKSVSLISDAILTSSDKPLGDFRDHSVLALDTGSVTSFDLKNALGEISAVKNGADWKIEKPRVVASDGDAISSLLSAVSSARISSFVNDSGTDLAKYGLAKPAITFSAKLSNGKTAELQVGKKEESDYDARDASRPTIFRVNDSLFKSLSEKLFDLRDKQLLHITASDIARAQMKNEKGTTTCVQSASGDLIFEQPAGAKGTPPECPGFVDSLEGARAQEIYDAPSAAIASSVAKAPIMIAITDKSGKNTEIRVSAVSGDAVYARTSAGPEIYKLDKQLFTDLDTAPPKQ